MTDTAKLIEQARQGMYPAVVRVCNALEAAEAERDEARSTNNANLALLVAAEAANRRLREHEDDLHERISLIVTGQTVDDAMAYVETRRELLGTDDPLAVFHATVFDARAALAGSGDE